MDNDDFCRMEILGYVLSMLMGFTLGVFGGGGSILTVPILVYVMSVNPVLATAYSLFVVGTTASIGSVRKALQGLVNWKIAFLFAVPSLLAVFLTRLYLVPAIPDPILELGGISISKDIGIMIFFGLIMLMASWSMIRGSQPEEGSELKDPSIGLVLLEGAVVGVITGIVGAGGGFLIVPALVLLVGLPMKEAVGTSLVIIAVKSLVGFSGDLQAGQDIDWTFLLLFTFFSIAGMAIGIYANRFISGAKLKQSFGWFILLMAIFILIREFYSL